MAAKCILIVDPHPVIADSLSVSLEQHPPFKAESCAAYTEAAGCVARVAPDLVVLSVYQHTVAESLATCRECAAASGKHMIVLLAPRELVEQESFTLDAIEAGADGVLIHEETDLQTLVETLGHLDAAHSLLDPRRLREGLANRRAAESSAEQPSPTEKLTPRERDVADLVMAGKTTPEIAEQLSISERTVQTHISNILAKLNVRTRAEAAVQLYQWRIEQQPGESAAKPQLAD
ncbi:MAG TPA: response regulator transcription factor [Herpetosiphonaceae bacterium]